MENNDESNGSAGGHDGHNQVQPIVIPSEQGNPNCPVCLNRIANRAYTNTCLHEFCHPCIDQWSQDHNRCPVCREVYTKIFFNVTSDGTKYEESPVVEPPQERSHGFMIIIGGNAIMSTPELNGLYIVNPIPTPHGIHYSTLFLPPNQAFFLRNVNPSMMIVSPNQLQDFLQNVDQFSLGQFMGHIHHHGRHGLHRHHHHHNHDRDRSNNNNNQQDHQ